jgi:flagellar biosynthesis component FlhA
MSDAQDEDDDLLSSWNAMHGKPTQQAATSDPTIDKRLKEMEAKKDQLRKEKDKKLADIEARLRKEEEERKKAEEERKKKKLEEMLKAAGVVEEDEKASFERTTEERPLFNRYSGWTVPKFKVMSSLNVKTANDAIEESGMIVRSVQYVHNTKYMDKEGTQVCVHLYIRGENVNVVRYRNKGRI